VTPKHGKCKKGYQLTLLGAEGAEGKAGAQGKAGAEGKQGPEGKTGLEGKAGAEGKTGPEGKAGFTPAQAEQLKALLPYVKLVPSGIAGKPTVEFSGVNVQIVNGAGKTASTNGEGNIVIGYDENAGKHEQTGSHDLILGQEQTFTSTSFGGILAGEFDTISAPFASVLGGVVSTASGEFASVSGGYKNTASGLEASVSGGAENTASGGEASVSGGARNTASEEESSVSGGDSNKASAAVSWIGGGFKNEVFSNELVGEEGLDATIFGGKENKTAKDYEAIP
jgi:hypothetical protein